MDEKSLLPSDHPDTGGDALLCMAGAMDTTFLAPSVNLATEPYSFRRTVYGYIDRSNMPDLFMHFDMANPNEPNSKRTSSRD